MIWSQLALAAATWAILMRGQTFNVYERGWPCPCVGAGFDHCLGHFTPDMVDRQVAMDNGRRWNTGGMIGYIAQEMMGTLSMTEHEVIFHLLNGRCVVIASKSETSWR